MTYEEWVKLSNRGTSGDMVWDILYDWGTERKIYTQLDSPEAKAGIAGIIANTNVDFTLTRNETADQIIQYLKGGKP